MIIETHSDREREDTLRLLRVINTMRPHRFDTSPLDYSPWITTREPKPQYL